MTETQKPPLKVGDMVSHGSGTQVMQLAEIDAGKGRAVCRWYGPRGGEKRGTFLLASLVKAAPRRAIGVTFR